MSALRGIVRLLNTAGGRVLCLAGEVDATAVDDFRVRYGREPARIDRIDAGSVTAWSASGEELLLDHLAVAALAGRPVAVCPVAQRLLDEQGRETTASSGRAPDGGCPGREPYLFVQGLPWGAPPVRSAPSGPPR